MNQTTNDVSSEESAGMAGISETDRHRLLASERRRVALEILTGRTDPVDLDDLAAGIVGREDDVDAADEAAVERVAVQLHHMHLPKMAELGIIDYDPATNRIDSCPTRSELPAE